MHIVDELKKVFIKHGYLIYDEDSAEFTIQEYENYKMPRVTFTKNHVADDQLLITVKRIQRTDFEGGNILG